MTVIYTFLYFWFKVFKIDILNNDLFDACAATDMLFVFIFLIYLFFGV